MVYHLHSSKNPKTPFLSSSQASSLPRPFRSSSLTVSLYFCQAVVAHGFNLSTREVETGDLYEFEDSLVYKS